ncbi:MAG: hypothetical protein K2M17_05145 [Bacilli bacterium]|nr:hypothetical protein [Bacilli bacterium]
MTVSLKSKVEMASSLTRRVAEMKDWRVRNKHNFAMRNIARDWMENHEGYFVGTFGKLKELYGDLIECKSVSEEIRGVWAIMPGIKISDKFRFVLI